MDIALTPDSTPYHARSYCVPEESPRKRLRPTEPRRRRQGTTGNHRISQALPVYYPQKSDKGLHQS